MKLKFSAVVLGVMVLSGCGRSLINMPATTTANHRVGASAVSEAQTVAALRAQVDKLAAVTKSNSDADEKNPAVLPLQLAPKINYLYKAWAIDIDGMDQLNELAGSCPSSTLCSAIVKLTSPQLKQDKKTMAWYGQNPPLLQYEEENRVNQLEQSWTQTIHVLGQLQEMLKK